MNTKTDVLTVYISGKIRQFRESAGLTQDQLASKIGISRVTLVNIEGANRELSVRRLFEIAEILSLNPGDLLPDLSWWKKNKAKKLRKIITYEVFDE